jgi:hypothetical protein
VTTAAPTTRLTTPAPTTVSQPTTALPTPQPTTQPTIPPTTTALLTTITTYKVQFTMSLAISGPTLNVTEYMQAVSKIAADSNCGACPSTASSVVECERCTITVNVTYAPARRLLASTAILDTSIAAKDQATATTLAEKLNTTSTKQAISTSLGGATVVFLQPPQVVVVVTQVQIPPTQTPAPSSDSGNTLVIVVISLVAVLLLVIVGVVVYLVMRPSAGNEVHIHNYGPTTNQRYPDSTRQLLGRRALPMMIEQRRPEPARPPSVGRLIYRTT